MNMFVNYQNPYQEIPNNQYKAFHLVRPASKLDPIEASKPYELFDTKGNLEGYYWNYGDSINLEFNIDGEITIESDALILKRVGEAPATAKLGAKVGTRCYNIVDLRSWTCVGIENHTFAWTEDPEFSYMLNGDRSIYVSAADYLRDKTLIAHIYNFRFEEIYKEYLAGSTQAILTITPELSKELTKGIYYCSLEVVGNNTQQTIFNAADCKLLVK